MPRVDGRTLPTKQAVASGLLPLEGPTDWQRVRKIVGWWLLAIAVALVLDWPVAKLAATPVGEGGREFCEVLRTSKFARQIKMPGNAVFTLVVALVVGWLHPWRERAGSLVLFPTGLAALAVQILKWVFGRLRPKLERVEPELGINVLGFDFFRNGWEGLFHGVPNLATPSGHTAQAFATAAALAYLAPRGRWLFYFGAALVGFERFGERAHYFSDVVAGAGVGIASFHVVLKLGFLLTAHERKKLRTT